MQLYSIFLTAADTSYLGRVAKSSLSTQTLMEIFFAGIENREVICGSGEEPAEIEKWEGFEYCHEQPTNYTEKHFKIAWTGRKLVGSIDLQWLPLTLSSLQASRNKLGGSLNTNALPPSIQVLDLCFNELSGEIDLRHLPAKIKALFLSKNQLSGSLNLEKLPQSIEVLYLACNHFSGSVCFRHLPASLQELSVGENDLFGMVDLTRLPVTMNSLWLHSNYFEGKTDFSELPESLEKLYVSYTNLSGKIIARNGETFFDVENSNVELVQ